MDPKAPAKQSTSGASTQAKQPKLKDTCTACASSKLRCSRDKPVCKRCELRGLSCHYDTSKRSGRTSQATKAAQERRQREEEEERLREEQRNQCQPPPNTPLQMRSNATFASSQAPAPVAPMIPMPETGLSPLSLPTTLAPDQDAFAWIESLNQEDMIAWNDTWNVNQQDFDSSLPLSLPTQASNVTGNAFENTALTNFGSHVMTDHNAVQATVEAPPKMSRSVTMPVSTNMTSTSASSDSLSSISEKWNHVSSSSSSVLEMSFDELISKSNIPSATCTSSPEPPNCCLSVAVGFLVQLTPNPKASCTMSGNDHGSNPIQERNTTIEDNRQIVDELVKILGCRCSQDGYLLTIISLVLFKAMSRYVCTTPYHQISSDSLTGMLVSLSKALQDNKARQTTPPKGEAMAIDELSRSMTYTHQAPKAQYRPEPQPHG